MENVPIGQLAVALAAFQLDLPQIGKGETATVQTKAGGQYQYTYADLADVSRAVLPALARHGLAWICTLNDGVLSALLIHGESGETISSTWRVPDSEDPKAIGSQLTYGRRYLLMTMTGVHPAGEDDDGHAAVARQSPPPPVETPLVRLIRRGREAGHSDERIRSDLDDVAQGRQHVDLTADDMRPLFTKYTEEFAQARARAELAADAGPNSPQALNGNGMVTRGGIQYPVPDEAESGPEQSDVDIDDRRPDEAESGAVPGDWPATAQPPTAAELASYDQGPATVDDGEPVSEVDPYGGADPDADPVAEEGATEAEVIASTSAVEAAKRALNERLAARRAGRGGS